MKKFISVLLAVFLTALLCGCGDNGGNTQNTENPASSAVSSVTSNASASEAKPSELSYTPKKCDVDLTKLSSTLVYSEVYNMVNTPEKYIGKTVRMKGTFSVYHDDETNKNYFACLIADATACCSQGLEFELNGNYEYPYDYPNVNDEITVSGKFSTYTENSVKYCMLSEAILES